MRRRFLKRSWEKKNIFQKDPLSLNLEEEYIFWQLSIWDIKDRDRETEKGFIPQDWESYGSFQPGRTQSWSSLTLWRLGNTIETEGNILTCSDNYPIRRLIYRGDHTNNDSLKKVFSQSYTFLTSSVQTFVYCPSTELHVLYIYLSGTKTRGNY